MSLLILRLGPPRSARRRVSARQRVLQGGHQTHHHCTKAQKQDAKYRNTSLRNTEIQSCKHKNTSTQKKEYKQSEINNYCTKTKTRQSVLQGGHQGHHDLHQSAKTKCEIQKYKPLKYRNTDNLKSVNIARREKLNFIAERYKPCNYVTLIYHLNKICGLWIIANE